eukprot:gnl/TRDRNA2_/TRDRNA2_73585_c0_seq1.p1 gnl/TRDRNA2_/TRDRNA2_73585_c0~~gnl/TRDRNA2_/TRDRNA2_73585_c0_seq1.p1  ORF type:complete len:306 (-),score=67.16 gnl/TRDRNA2_/TRDRNA2_73585_c0_seq1:303-1190(-)
MAPHSTWQGLTSTRLHDAAVPFTPAATGVQAGDSIDTVPADHAEKHLWSVALEYERLHDLQGAQQALAAQQQEAELAHLRAVAQMLSGGGAEEVGAATRRRAKEEETSLMLKTKEKELEFLLVLLQLRDRQAGDLRRMCEVTQSRIEQLQRNAAAAEAMPASLPSQQPRKQPEWLQHLQRLPGNAHRTETSHLESTIALHRSELDKLASTLEARKKEAEQMQSKVFAFEAAARAKHQDIHQHQGQLPPPSVQPLEASVTGSSAAHLRLLLGPSIRTFTSTKGSCPLPLCSHWKHL